MARTVNVNFRMDSELKKNMEQVCQEMGLSMTAAFTIFAKTVTRQNCFPFFYLSQNSSPNTLLFTDFIFTLFNYVILHCFILQYQV